MARYLSRIRVQIGGYTKISENPIVLQMRTGNAGFRLKEADVCTLIAELSNHCSDMACTIETEHGLRHDCDRSGHRTNARWTL